MSATQLSMFDTMDTGYTRINKSFHLTVPYSGALISEAFGIEDNHVNKIVDILIPNDFDVMYITGESGSGKTTILNEYISKKKYTRYEMSEDEKNIPLFSLGGEDESEIKDTLTVLTSVGLSDAVLWMGTYYELSDSQQARCRVAVNMMHSDVVVVDEFLSTLDRETAKPVAYSIQKATRKLGKKLIVATAHSDLDEYLSPNITVRGSAFPSRWEVKTNQDISDDNIILNETVFKYGSKEEYRESRLGELHYKGKYTGGTKEFLFAYYNEKMVALLVSTYNMHTGGRRISRVVVHPSFRGCGIGKTIIKRYIKDYPNTDVIAAMALYNPVFEKAGMIREDDVSIEPPKGISEMLGRYGFDFNKWGDKGYVNAFVKDERIREEISKFADKASSVICPGGERIPVEEMQIKIKNDCKTAGRVLFFFRPRTLAKYIVKNQPDEETK